MKCQEIGMKTTGCSECHSKGIFHRKTPKIVMKLTGSSSSNLPEDRNGFIPMFETVIKTFLSFLYSRIGFIHMIVPS
jgi:hypothetical protein